MGFLSLSHPHRGESGITARYRRSETCLVKGTCHLPLNVRRIYQIHAITPSGKSGESSSPTLSLSLDIPNLIFYRRAKLSSLPLRSLFFIVTSIVINNRTTMIRTGRSRRNVGNKTRIFPRKQFLTILRSTFLRRFFFSLIASGLKFKFDSLQESSFFIVHFRFISIYKSVRAGIWNFVFYAVPFYEYSRVNYSKETVSKERSGEREAQEGSV